MAALNTGLLISSEMMELIGKSEDELKIDLAIYFYKQLNLSSGQAAKFAGIPRVIFYQELGKRKVPINYTEEDALKDVETMKQFNEKFPSNNDSSK